jgi:hypothetical protein
MESLPCKTPSPLNSSVQHGRDDGFECGGGGEEMTVVERDGGGAQGRINGGGAWCQIKVRICWGSGNDEELQM